MVLSWLRSLVQPISKSSKAARGADRSWARFLIALLQALSVGAA